MNLARHDIYADNSLLGEALLFSLSLPQVWKLAPGVSRPEVSATHERVGKSWVVTGSGWYVVYQEEKRWVMELAAHIRPLKKNSSPLSGETIWVASHPGQVKWCTKRRGLPWRRHDVTFMTVTFDCPTSERHLELEFSGWCPQDGFFEMLTALQHLRCH